MNSVVLEGSIIIKIKEGEEDMNVTTNGACPRSYVTHIFRYAYVGHGGDRKILELVMSVKTSDFLLSIQRLSGNHDMNHRHSNTLSTG